MPPCTRLPALFEGMRSLLRAFPTPNRAKSRPSRALAYERDCMLVQVSAKLNGCYNYCQVGATAGLSVLPPALSRTDASASMASERGWWIREIASCILEGVPSAAQAAVTVRAEC